MHKRENCNQYNSRQAGRIKIGMQIRNKRENAEQQKYLQLTEAYFMVTLWKKISKEQNWG